MSTPKTLLILTALLTLAMAACAEQNYNDDGGMTDVEPGAEVQRQDLRVAMGADNLFPVGVTVEPGTGRRLVLDAARGIYEVDVENNTASLVWGLEQVQNYGISLNSSLTDIVAIEEGVFALTAISDGFLLDLNNDTMRQHFCYEPDFFDEPFEEPVLQITQSVTFDANSSLIIAQPQTIMADGTGGPMESFVSTYDRTTGADLQWFEMPAPDYVAGAMAFDVDGSLLMGIGGRLDRYEMGQTPLSMVNLEPLGVTDIQGMALDPNTGTLLVIDAATHNLIEVDLNQL